MPDSNQTARFRFWLWLIRLIGVIVPRRLRADWRQEWEAELRHRELLLADWDKLNWKTKFDLIQRSLGAFWDALILQPQRMEDDMFQDLRFGVRMLAKNPGFALTAIFTLALGIGANTAVFSVVNAVLLKPLPYPESEWLVFLSERTPNFPMESISYPNFTDWREQQTVFEHIGVYNQGNYNLTGRGEPRRLFCAQISADAFAALSVQAVVGRVFSDDEDKPGANPVVVLSHGLWQDLFGGDATIINQSITLERRAYTVIGVMPADFVFPSRVDLWTPVGPLATNPVWQNRINHPGLFGVARLKPDKTLDQARAEMDAIAARLEQQYPESNKDSRTRIDPLLDNYVGNASAALWTLLGSVGLVLLIACANVANLLFARAAARQREMSVRAALGAGRMRIVRQLLTESLVLTAAGGAIGVLLARSSLPLLLAISGDAIPRSSEISLDAGVMTFTVVVAVLTGLLFGLAPAWQASRVDLHHALKETAQSLTGARTWLRQAIIIAEVALTLVLLVGTGLRLRSFYQLQQVNAGFTHEHVLTFRLDLPPQKYPLGEPQSNFYRSLQERLRALPGVEAAGFASQFPMGHNGWQTRYLIEGQPVPPPNQMPNMEATLASPDYFRALGIPLVRGRSFTEQDNREHLRGRDLTGLTEIDRVTAGLNVIIIDEAFAAHQWPNEDPIGKQIRMPWGPLPAQQPVLTVVGVVALVKLRRLGEGRGLEQAYLPALQATFPGMAVVIKSTLEPTQLIDAARQQVLALDSEQPIYEVRTLTERRDNSLASERLNLTLLVIFSTTALLLAAVGLYGVISYSATQRTHEIGLRMALGASTGDILRLVVGQGMALSLVGVAIGLAASFALTRLMKTLLFDVSPTDPLTFGVFALLLTLVALLACYLPARRAIRVDPLVALRHD